MTESIYKITGGLRELWEAQHYDRLIPQITLYRVERDRFESFVAKNQPKDLRGKCEVCDRQPDTVLIQLREPRHSFAIVITGRLVERQPEIVHRLQHVYEVISQPDLIYIG